MAQTKIQGRLVHWRVGGTGRPAIMIHCMLAQSGAWTPMMAALDDHLAMLAVDLPGHGRTEYDATRDIQAQAVEDIVALAEATSESVHLIGHSFGATVALRAALEIPARVARLTLIEPVSFVLLSDADHPAYAKHLKGAKGFALAYRAGDVDTALREFTRVWGAGGKVTPAQTEYERARMPLVVASEATILRPKTKDRVHLADLAKIKCPVHLIEGELSPPVIRAIHDVIAAAMPQARRDIVPEAGHMSPVTHPREVAALIRENSGE